MLTNKIEFSDKSIIKVILWGVLFYLVYYFRSLVLVLFIAIIIASIVNRFVSLLKRIKIPRLPAVIIFYASFLFLVFLFIYNFLPSTVSYLGDNLKELPSLLNYFKSVNTDSYYWYSNFLSYLVDTLKTVNTDVLVGNVRSWIFNTSIASSSLLINTMVNFVLTIIISFYIALSEKGVHNFLRLVSPKKHEDYIDGLFDRVQRKISGWFFGQVLVAFIVSIMVLAVLLICGIPFAIPIAIIAFVFELMPVVGVTMSSIPALFFAWNIGGPSLALIVLISFFLISQISSYFLYPKIIGKFVGIPTVLVIIALFIGVEVAGFLGALIAIPVATIAMELLEDFKKLKENQI